MSTAPKKTTEPAKVELKKHAVDPKKVFKLPKAGQGTPTSHKPAKFAAGAGFKLESSTVRVDPHAHKVG